MSTVGSMSMAQDPLFLQAVQGQNPTSAVGRPQNGRQGFGARLDAAAQSAGLNSSQVTQLHTDIQDAVQAALQNAPGDGTNRAAVKNAIDTVLQKYGIDPAALRPQHAGGAHRHHGAGQAGSGQPRQNDGDADDASTTSSASTASSTTSTSSSSSSTGTPQNATDAAIATLLRGLPSGSLLDTAG
jgi:hypothetical protein